MGELRRRGISCDTDYAGRSAKGQLRQGERLGASVMLFAGADSVILRRRGEEDRTLAYEEVVDALA